MANQTFKLSSTVTIERIEYTNGDDYLIKGSGNLTECKSKFGTYNPKWIEVYICGNFETIEDSCFSKDNIRCVELRNGGSYRHIANKCFCSSKLERIVFQKRLKLSVITISAVLLLRLIFRQ